MNLVEHHRLAQAALEFARAVRGANADDDRDPHVVEADEAAADSAVQVESAWIAHELRDLPVADAPRL